MKQAAGLRAVKCALGLLLAKPWQFEQMGNLCTVWHALYNIFCRNVVVV